jgi:hypothetical protein
MGLIRIFISLAGLVLVAGTVFYFLPDSIKEKGLTYINESPYVPQLVKEAAEDLYATPAYKRKELAIDLEKNLAEIQLALENSPTKQPELVKKVQEAQTMLKEVLQFNDQPTAAGQLINTLTEKVTERVTGKECPIK